MKTLFCHTKIQVVYQKRQFSAKTWNSLQETVVGGHVRDRGLAHRNTVFSSQRILLP